MFVIFSASNPESKECPYSGKYAIENNQHSRRKRSVQAEQDSVRRKREQAKEHNHRVVGSRMLNFNVRNMSDAPMLRSKRQSDGSDISCVINNYNKLEVGCNSVKNMEFYSTCQNKEYVTGEFRKRYMLSTQDNKIKIKSSSVFYLPAIMCQLFQLTPAMVVGTKTVYHS